MEQYANLGILEGNPSNIVAYELGNECIDLVFGRDRRTGVNMKYSYSSEGVGVDNQGVPNEGVGADNMARMHELARAGQGLLTFINTTPEVRTGYDSKEPYDLG